MNRTNPFRGMFRRDCLLGLLLAGVASAQGVLAAQIPVTWPAGSSTSSARLVPLPNGHVVLVDPDFTQLTPSVITAVGAVHLYDGNGVLISTLKGTSANDRVGSHGITVLANGNFVVRSPNWRFGAVAAVGAATFVSGFTGLNGTVSSVNSLIGSTANDNVGFNVLALANGDYVVGSPGWSHLGTDNAGAATWGSGTAGVRGVVGTGNSLYGTHEGDNVGSSMVALPDGQYILLTPQWDNGSSLNAGALTKASGPRSGAIASGNSLVGAHAGSSVGSGGVTVLPNGAAVAAHPNWGLAGTPNIGAVMLIGPAQTPTGGISAANALVGTNSGDQVGSGITVLPDGRYVVSSPRWSGTSGAVTVCSATGGCTGAVSASNSLVGRASGDEIGYRYNPPGEFPRPTIIPVGGGFVVTSPHFDQFSMGLTDVGAVTFVPDSGLVGPVTESNSLVGMTSFDRVGQAVTPLANGNYVVTSHLWGGGGLERGAVTLVTATANRTGIVSPANSLVGSQNEHVVGRAGVFALASGNYVVASQPTGAVTFGSGTTGVTGAITTGNSLMTGPGDEIRVHALANGNYVVVSGNMLTWGSGATGVTGLRTAANSYLGTLGNPVNQESVVTFPNGHFAIGLPGLDVGSVTDAGGIVVANGNMPFLGPVTAANAIVGQLENDRVGGYSYEIPGNRMVSISYSLDHQGIMDAGAVSLLRAVPGSKGMVTTDNSVFGNQTSVLGSELPLFDDLRNVLAVPMKPASRMVLFRPGSTTTTTLSGHAPNPSGDNQPVTFTAQVAFQGSLNDGRVIVRAGNGAVCTDTTATVVNATTVAYSCALAFPIAGSYPVFAEYLGSATHGYSRTTMATHVSTASGIFSSGFE